METIRVVCAHDCPDMCSLLAEVEDGRVVRIEGDPDQPFTAGFACAKVNRDAELVHSPERLATPLRRVGAKGEGKFAPISWDEALDEIVGALAGDHRRIGAAGAARLRLQRASGADQPRPRATASSTRSAPAGCAPARCATPAARTAWNMTVGPGRRRRPGGGRRQSDLIVSWGADLVATNVHFWAKVEAAQQARRAGSSSSTRAAAAPPAAPTGTCRSASAPTPRWRSGSCTSWRATGSSTATISPPTRSASTGSKPRCCRASRPTRVAAITGLAVADIERFAALYGAAKALLHPPRRGHDAAGARRRGVARGGAAAGRHRRLRPPRRRRAAADRGVVRARLRRRAQAVRPGRRPASSTICGSARRCSNLNDPPIRGALHRRQQPGGDLPRRRQGAPRASPATICSPSSTTRS